MWVWVSVPVSVNARFVMVINACMHNCLYLHVFVCTFSKVEESMNIS